MISHRFLVPLVSLGVMAPLAAQSLPVYNCYEQFAWPGRAAHSGVWRGMARARLTDGGQPDLVVLAGQEAVLMVTPALVRQLLPLPGAEGLVVNAICAHPGAADTPRDAVLLATTSGLYRVEDASGTDPTPVVQLSSSSAWANVSQLQVADLGGTTVVVGLDVTAPLNCKLLQTSASVPGATTTLGIARDSLAFTVCDWNADHADDFVVASAQRITVHSAGGAVLAQSPALLVGAHLTRLATPTGPMAAMALQFPDGSWQLASGNAAAQYAVPLTGIDVAGIAGGDTNGDGYGDLFLSRASQQSAVVLMNLLGTGQAPFALATGTGYDVNFVGAPSQAGNQAIANIADLDGDGDGDLVYPLHGNGNVGYASAPFAGSSDFKVGYVGIHPTHYATQTSVYVDVGVPQLPVGATHVEMRAWRVVGSGSASETLPGPLASVSTPLPGTTGFPTDYMYFPRDVLRDDAAVLCLRLVRRVGDAVVAGWPPSFVILTENQGVADALDEIPGWSTYGGGIGGSTGVVVVVVGKVPPPPDDDETPVGGG